MKRKKKTYSHPKKPFDKLRIDGENAIRKQFGLKNKREIWKAEARVKQIRDVAKSLITATEAEKEKLFQRLQKQGINVTNLGDVLSLTKEDYMKRRLQSILVEKNMARTPKQARQLITHNKVLVNGVGVNSPSYVVSVEEENKISLKEKKHKAVAEKKTLEGEENGN